MALTSRGTIRVTETAQTSASAIHFVCISISRSARPSLDNYANRCVASSAQTKDRANIIFPSAVREICFAVTLDGFMNRKLRTPLAEKSRLEAEEASEVDVKRSEIN